jgi:TRAP-type mannitol/chloroaromatic compound transport system substrate-binding protein
MDWRKQASGWVGRSVPEVMDIHGLKVSVWEIAVDLEELDG